MFCDELLCCHPPQENDTDAHPPTLKAFYLLTSKAASLTDELTFFNKSYGFIFTSTATKSEVVSIIELNRELKQGRR